MVLDFEDSQTTSRNAGLAEEWQGHGYGVPSRAQAVIRRAPTLTASNNAASPPFQGAGTGVAFEAGKMDTPQYAD